MQHQKLTRKFRMWDPVKRKFTNKSYRLTREEYTTLKNIQKDLSKEVKSLVALNLENEPLFHTLIEHKITLGETLCIIMTLYSRKSIEHLHNKKLESYYLSTAHAKDAIRFFQQHWPKIKENKRLQALEKLTILTSKFDEENSKKLSKQEQTKELIEQRKRFNEGIKRITEEIEKLRTKKSRR